MSLLTEIQNNTSSVVNGKLNLAQAITNKGGVLNDYVLVPTFSNLVNGVASIETGMKVNFSKEVTILAENIIAKGDVCSLVAVESDIYSANAIGSLPTSCTNSYGGSYNSNGDRISLEGGRLLLFPSQGSLSSCVFYFPFMWNGTAYEQMTVDGAYSYVYDGGKKHHSSKIVVNMTFDSLTGRLYIGDTSHNNEYSHNLFRAYQVDFETKNLTALQTGKGITGSAMSLLAHNDCIFFNTIYQSSISSASTNTKIYMAKFDATANALGTMVEISSKFPMYTSGSNLIMLDIAYNDALGHIYVVGIVGNTAAIIRLDKGVDGSYTVYGNTATIPVSVKGNTFKFQGKSASYYYSHNLNLPNVNITAGGIVACVTTSGEFKYYILEPDSMTLTEFDVPFDDSLDKTLINSFKLTKDGQFLVLKSTDSNYTTVEQTRVYAYKIGTAETSGFKFIGTTNSLFSPAVGEGYLPHPRPSSLTDPTKLMYYTSSTTGNLYDLHKVVMEAEYTANPSSNGLSGALAYGIAMEDIAVGSVGKAVLILS